MRVLTASFVLAGVLLYPAGAAGASTTWGCTGNQCQVGVGTAGSTTATETATGPPASGETNSSGPCPPGQVATYMLQTEGGSPALSQPGDLNPITGTPVPPGSQLDVVSCNGVYLTTVVVPPSGAAPGPGTTGADLARQALARFEVAPPAPRISPSHPVVGTATWLWVASGWTARSATASVPGLSATVTAQPRSVVWDMGDGDQVTCDGPGRAWNADQPDATTDCSYTYPVAGRFTITATIYYQATWSASDGTAGRLGAISGRTTVPVTVDEVQAVND